MYYSSRLQLYKLINSTLVSNKSLFLERFYNLQGWFKVWFGGHEIGEDPRGVISSLFKFK
jgi:hypothetical protein